MNKLWSEIKYWLVILIILTVAFELIASMILFRKYTPARSATAYLISNLITKPDVGQYSYEPWLMFRVADYHSDTVNVSGFERKSTPDTFIKAGSPDTVDIYFFGGSAMFGDGISDDQTIPSVFVSAYKAQNPATSIRVKNFGNLHYYSKQELMLLTSLLFEGDRPDIVVFLDGLNDFYPARMLYYDRPFFSYALQQSFDGKMFQKGNETFIDSTAELYNDPPGISAIDYNNELIAKYINNLRMAAQVCKIAGIKSYFFCEPVSFYTKANNEKSYKGNFNRFAYIYPELEKNKDSIPNFYFLGNLDLSAEKIATQILNAVKNDLR